MFGLKKSSSKSKAAPAAGAAGAGAPAQADNSATLEQMPAPEAEGPSLLDEVTAAVGPIPAPVQAMAAAGTAIGGAKKGLMSGVKSAGKGLASGAKGAGKAVASGAKGAGKAVASGAKGVGKALGGGGDDDEHVHMPGEFDDIDQMLAGLHGGGTGMGGLWNQKTLTEQTVGDTADMFGGGADGEHKMAANWVAITAQLGKGVGAEVSDADQERIDAPKTPPAQLDDRVSGVIGLPNFGPAYVQGLARTAFKQIAPADLDRYRQAGLTTEEMMALYLYTTNVAYSMNAVLRGQIEDPHVIRTLSPWCDLASSGARKLPSGAKNAQKGAGKIDPNAADDDWVDFDTVYRVDDWRDGFNQVVFDSYRQGGTLTEPAFLSTSMVKGSYIGGGSQVSRTIKGAQGAKTLRELSESPTENEALVPPGMSMKIDGIRDRDTGATIKDVGDHFGSVDEMTKHKIEVDATLQGGGGDKKPAAAPSSDGDTVDAADAPGPIEKRLVALPDNALT
jgi:hypothetical protein